jgi:predicted translin family RNA/ssDNA-binding protein
MKKEERMAKIGGINTAYDALNGAQEKLEYALQKVKDIKELLNLLYLLPDDVRAGFLEDLGQEITEKMNLIRTWEAGMLLSTLKEHIKEFIQSRITVKK